MPIINFPKTTASIGLEEFADFIESEVDVSSHEGLLSTSENLGALKNDRTFLAKKIVDELKEFATAQSGNVYTGQVIILESRKNWFMRANMWPKRDDPVLAHVSTNAFSYETPHDHNFNFLTIGYYGPGYHSDYYEYDSTDLVGYAGEKVALKFIEHTTLSEGKVMLYRSGIDVHSQYHPDDFSISINLISRGQQFPMPNQYGFDLAQGTLTGLINPNSSPMLVRMAAHVGDANTDDVLLDLLSTRHCPRTRVAAYEALAMRHPSDCDTWLTRAESDPSRYVQHHVPALVTPIAMANSEKSTP